MSKSGLYVLHVWFSDKKGSLLVSLDNLNEFLTSMNSVDGQKFVSVVGFFDTYDRQQCTITWEKETICSWQFYEHVGD